MRGVLNPDGEDVRAFAQIVTFRGDEGDANADQWIDLGDDQDFETLNGRWAYRVKNGIDKDYGEPSAARIRVIGERVYIRFLVTDEGNDYFIEARREGNRLVGRFWNPVQLENNGPWVGLIVNNRRIDSKWEGGRWDFRR